jgi:hypothetical protein
MCDHRIKNNLARRLAARKRRAPRQRSGLGRWPTRMHQKKQERIYENFKKFRRTAGDAVFATG